MEYQVKTVGSRASRMPVHLLSFDVEEYFHVESARAEVDAAQWDSYESRLMPAVDRILEILGTYRQTATFFVLGWVARRYPQIVRRIAESGHEIASHGMSHGMIGRLTAEQFANELTESKRLLEDIAGKPVAGFRALRFRSH